jgi:hypothetical protein
LGHNKFAIISSVNFAALKSLGDPGEGIETGRPTRQSKQPPKTGRFLA